MRVSHSSSLAKNPSVIMPRVLCWESRSPRSTTVKSCTAAVHIGRAKQKYGHVIQKWHCVHFGEDNTSICIDLSDAILMTSLTFSHRIKSGLIFFFAHEALCLQHTTLNYKKKNLEQECFSIMLISRLKSNKCTSVQKFIYLLKSCIFSDAIFSLWVSKVHNFHIY